MPTRTVHAVCSHDCPDSCGVLVTIDEGGRATKVQGDPKHPVTRGFLCGKVAKYLDRVYAPDRLLYPMRRRAGVAKGALERGREAEAFERISWDEALETIAKRLEEISGKYGPESILPYSYAGTIGVLGYGSMDRRFFYRLGASQLDRTICATTGGEALLSVYGRKLGTDTEAFRHAKLILAWAANVHGNNIHLWPFIEEARRHGARLIVIDPYPTRTARAADWHLAIRPGTDSALALGIMHILVRDGLDDREYVERWTHGFEQLRERIAEYPPERVAALTGIAIEDIEKLAREYGTTQPAVIRVNYGVQRSENGGAAMRAIAMLPALTGAWKQLGGGLQLSTSSAFRWNSAAVERPDLMMASPLGREARVVNMSLLGEALTGMRDPPVHALFVYNSNPAAVAPDQTAVLWGLRREDLFTVVHDLFFTDTADYADIVLPATTFLEHKDIQGAYGHYYVQLSEQAIAPLGEARPNVWLFAQLAQRMGFEEECFRDSADDLIDQALDAKEPEQQHAWMQGITRETLRAAGGMQRLKFPEERESRFQPFAEGPFATPSGRIEFFSEALAARGVDPLPGYVPAAESRHSAGRQRYPLEFLPRKADNYMNSTFANLPGHQGMEAAHAGVLEMHREDAAARGIADGDAVDVFNDRGRLRLRAQVHANGHGVAEGVVAARMTWNKLSEGGHNVNLLTSQRLCDFGGGPTFYSVLVEVERA
ncbi:MAG TPA: molybdopterin-dependent oxidoreductase, partial [Acidobacteriaceae bacterium]|nr:molybdopterin-dependent oxidoreductase [Acidobacteriaceae bacterium]